MPSPKNPKSNSPEQAGLLAAAGRIALGVFARLVVLFAIVLPLTLAIGYLGLKHLLWTDTAWLRGVLIDQAERRLGLGGNIVGLQTYWEGRNPAIRIQGLSISRVETAPTQPALSINSANIVLSWSSLLRGQLETKQVAAEGIAITAQRLAETRWDIAGFEFDWNAQGESKLLPWLLKQPSLGLKTLDVKIIDKLHLRGAISLGVNQAQLTSKRSQHEVLAAIGAVKLLTGKENNVLGTADLKVKWQSGVRDLLALDEWRGAVDWKLADLNLQAAAPLLLWAHSPLPTDARLAKLEKEISLVEQKLLVGLVQTSGQTEFARSKIDTAKLALSAADLQFGRLRFDQLTSEASLDLTKQALGLKVEKFNARRGAGDIALKKPAALRLALAPTLRVQSADAEFASLDLAWLSAWVAQGLEPGAVPIEGITPSLLAKWRERLAALAPIGRLIDPSIQLRDGDYSARAGFEHVSLKAQENRGARLGLPGITRLSGEVQANAKGGAFKLFANDSILEVPRLFADDKISLVNAATTGTWINTPDAPLEVKVDELRFQTPDGKGSASGRYRVGGKGLGLLDINGEIERADALRVQRYLPLAMPAQVRDWLQASLVAGQLSDTRFKLRGDIVDFPYDAPGSGEFLIQTQVSNGELVFAKGWPAIREIQGQLQIDRDSLSLKGKQAKIFEVELKDTEVAIPKFADGIVKVQGGGIGPGQDMIRYLNETPLGPLLDNFTAQTQVLGNAKLSMKLSVPLSDVSLTKFSGSVDFFQNQVKVDNSLPIFSDVVGSLEFDDKGYGLKDVRTTMLGSSMTVNARSQPDRSFAIASKGTMTAQAIQRLSPNLLTAFLKGEAAYDAQVKVEKGKVFLEVRSDLQGLVSELPAPLAKKETEALPLVMKISPRSSGPGDAIDIRLGPSLALQFERERLPAARNAPLGTPDSLRMLRGSLGYNIEPSLPDYGMSAAIVTDYLDVDAWRRLLATPLAQVLPSAPAEPNRGGLRDDGPGLDLVSGFELLPNQIALSAQTVLAGRREFKNLVLGGTREAGNWQFNLSANEFNGFAAWLDTGSTERSGTFVGRFTRLDLPQGRRAELEAFLQQTEDIMPELDIEADEFTLNGVAMGFLDFKAKNNFDKDNPSWQIESLEVSNADFSFQASGAWQLATSQRESQTSLDFEMNISESGRALERIGVKRAVRDAPGTLAGKAFWAGSPLAFDPASLSGTMRVDIQKGQFLRVDPGAAKLIGVLNMQALPRRLLLDFRDVTDEGFAFDAVNGDVTVRDGTAYFNRLTMRGIQAQVLISGSADLGKETQVLEVEVRPEVNAGGASLAYAAIVNPAIGLGTFVAQLLFRRPLQNLFAFKVDVTGTWANPVVKTRERAGSQVRDNGISTAP